LMSEKPFLPINVNIEHKKEVTQDIPEDVTRARNSAWLDVISPITEWAGLKGDTLRHKRALMRLEQESTLFELSQRLRERLENKTITPIPTKQLIPALEKASLEQPGSEFIEKWANLLASAAETPGDDVTICTSILGELGPTEAELLERARDHLTKTNLWPLANVATISQRWHEFAKNEYEQISVLLADHLDGKHSEAEVVPKLIDVAERSPNVIVGFEFAPTNGEAKSYTLRFTDAQLLAIDVLKYRNLLNTENYWEILKLAQPRTAAFRGTLTLNYFHLTNLGVHFLRRVSPA